MPERHKKFTFSDYSLNCSKEVYPLLTTTPTQLFSFLLLQSKNKSAPPPMALTREHRVPPIRGVFFVEREPARLEVGV